jgi:hypothetical protein
MNCVRQACVCVLLLLVASVAGAATVEEALVLVVDASSTLAQPDALAIRKAFMGLNATVQGQSFSAIINDSDASLRPAFLQHIVGFSEQAYQRRVLTLTLQQGRGKPSAYGDETALLQALHADNRIVTFMWQSHAARLGNLKVLKVLWQR